MTVSDRGHVAVLDLTDALAPDPGTCGRKAAALALAGRHGLPVLPGFVLTAPAAREVAAGEGGAELLAAVRARWAELSADGARPLVVRSSSAAEDTEDSSLAGRFTSVSGVRGWAGFEAAVREVVASADAVPEAAQVGIAVLVQLQVDPAHAGVLFGVDPVTGRSDRVVVSAVRGSPEGLVSGTEQGSRFELDREGRLRDSDVAEGGPRLGRRDLRRLAQLQADAAEVFGGPQDVEWALEPDGRLWLLQSRPVTTAVVGRPVGPVLGRGPLAETFPEALAPLEVDLWLAPLREAVVAALRVTGAAGERHLEGAEVVTVVDGVPVADLELLEGHEPDPRWWRRLDVRPGARRLRAAWRVGKLRSALPALGEAAVAACDRQLAAVPPLAGLSTRQLVALLLRTEEALRSVHAHEILTGLVLAEEAPPVTGAAAAARVLAGAREQGLGDDEVVARHPVVLALAPPRVGARPQLPEDVVALPAGAGAEVGGTALLREQLRLRARWLQEVSAQAAHALGERLAADGALPAPEEVRQHRLEDLVARVFEGRALPAAEQDADGADGDGRAPDLPARFRRTDRGAVLAVRTPGAGGGRGAGGGVGAGPVVHDAADPPEGAVLVVTDLDPRLARVLPRLAGLVAESGDPLAHLAILAREQGVATVVGHPDARERFPEGAQVRVDGESGQVTRTDGAADGEQEGERS